MTYNNNDDFDAPGQNGFLGTIGPKAAFFIVLIALSFMIGVVWNLYKGAGQQDGQSVPVIRADKTPVKVIPEDAGGMEIAHKDSTIFSSLRGQNDEENEKIENLLADNTTEEPLPRSQLFAGLNTAPQAIETVTEPTPLDQPASAPAETNAPAVMSPENTAPETVNAIEPAAMPQEDHAPEPNFMPVPVPEPEMAEIVIENKPEAKPEPEPKPEPSPKPQPEPESVRLTSLTEPPAPIVTGSYFVQLASTPDRASAEKEWTKLSSKYQSVLTGLSHRIESADLGTKGVYHRIQVGPLSKAQADQTCAAIKKINPQGCLIKKQ